MCRYCAWFLAPAASRPLTRADILLSDSKLIHRRPCHAARCMISRICKNDVHDKFLPAYLGSWLHDLPNPAFPNGC